MTQKTALKLIRIGIAAVDAINGYKEQAPISKEAADFAVGRLQEAVYLNPLSGREVEDARREAKE